MSRTLHAFGLGVASENANGDILDVFFPAPRGNISGGLADASTVYQARSTTHRSVQSSPTAERLVMRRWQPSLNGYVRADAG